MKTVAEVIGYFKKELSYLYEPNELKQIIEIVITYYLNITKTELLLNKLEKIPESNKQRLLAVLKELKELKPLAYILGEWEFYGLPFKVNQHTLIPRPETEELVHLIIKENKGKATILDIGTGSGCISITLKKNNSSYNVSAFDISTKALEIAKENATLNNVEVYFKEYDIIKNRNKKLNDKLDIIVSNPPYIPIKEKSLMHKNVLDYEPDLALFVENNNPIIFYEAIAAFAKLNLTDKGKLYFEINENYGLEVYDMLKNKGFKRVELLKDINNKDRIVKALIN